MFNNLKDNLIKLVTHRLFLMFVIFACLFAAIISRLFTVQIVEGQTHLDNFEYKTLKDLELASARGNIYDANGTLLAYNKLAYKATYDNSTEYSDLAKKNGTTANYEMNKALNKLIQMLEKNGDSIISDFPIVMNSKGDFKFAISSKTVLTRFHKEVYKISNTEKMSDIEAKQMKATAEEMFQYMRSGKGSSNPEKIHGYDISGEYSDEEAIKIMSIRYNIDMKRYTQYDSYTIAMDISDKSVSEISENQDIYLGVNVVADSLRVYNDSKYFSQIIGYTGISSSEELESLNKGKSERDPDYYKANAVVGKSGLEQEMESYLQGTKGSRKVFVNNMGKILEEIDRTDATAGNDVYLSIDSDLQKYCYDTLEQRIAGILLNNMTAGGSLNDKTKNTIAIKKFYYALIDNNVIDTTEFNRKNASENEKSIYSKKEQKQKSVIETLITMLRTNDKALNTLNKEYQEYMKYIYSMLNNNNILVSTNMKADDSMVIAWKNDKAGLGEFLKYSIQKSWVDVSDLNINNDFYDIDTIYDKLMEYISEELASDSDFDKIVYKYMIDSGSLSGKEICLVLYNQGVLNSKKDEDYEKLLNGSLGSYNFMRTKIKKREITPADLALDPCSGSIMVTDPSNGKVLAMVSYPGYDNNKLANSVDSDYYDKLIHDKSLPMNLRPLQQRTAPGSTFKPVVAAAGLEENAINIDTSVNCTGVFTKIGPQSPKCWRIYGHGRETVVSAIKDSCNVFFYDVGYRLGIVNGVYNSETGLEKLAKYATMFGFDRKSGIELDSYELSPQISNKDSVRSAIGQGTNNFTPAQISRYLTTLASQGNCYDLSILDSVKDADGKTIKKYKAKVANKVELSQTTWDSISKGMYQVVNNGTTSMRALFKNAGLDVAGKTGTAQESALRANHALFVSYSPSVKPKITTTVVVPFGYSSSNAAQIASDVYKHYFKVEDTTEKGKSKIDTTLSNSNSQTD